MSVGNSGAADGAERTGAPLLLPMRLAGGERREVRKRVACVEGDAWVAHPSFGEVRSTATARTRADGLLPRDSASSIRKDLEIEVHKGMCVGVGR